MHGGCRSGSEAAWPEVDPKGWKKFRRFLGGAAACPGDGPKSAIHSGLESALGSHPCVGLSSYQAQSLINLKEKVIHSGKISAKSQGVRGATPPMGQDLLLIDCRGNRSVWGAIAERLVGAPVIVKAKISVQGLKQIGPAGEVAGIEKFVLQTASQALDENIVQGRDRVHPC